MNLARLSRSVVISLGTLSLAWAQAHPNPSSPSSDDGSVPSVQSPNRPAPQSNQPPDPLLDLPRMKQDRASLIGGSLEKVDRVGSRLVLRPFGRGKLTIAFDPRTQFLRGNEIANARDLHPGERIYVETVLVGTAMFARAIHMPTNTATGTALGQIIAYDAAGESLSIRDQLSSRPVPFHMTSQTIITGAGIGPGALVQVSFLPGKDPALVREILVLAAPGSVFTFAGRITFLDLASHELVLANRSDDNRYEIQFNPAALEADAKQHLQEGARVAIAARFDGQRYVADSVTVLPNSSE